MEDLGMPLSPAEMKLARRVDIVAASAREAARAARKQEAEARELQAQVRRQQAAKQKAEAERQRAEDKRQAALFRAAQREPAGFNAVDFHRDLMAAARGLGITKQAALATDAGVQERALTDMRKGLAPTLGTVLVLCDWAGMNPLQYLVRLAPGAANDGQAEAAA